jgi:hypothetical protein
MFSPYAAAAIFEMFTLMPRFSLILMIDAIFFIMITPFARPMLFDAAAIAMPPRRC